TRAALAERGIEIDLVELEVKGIPKILERHGLTFDSLGLKGCTLFYRRSAADMPLMEIPEDADERRLEKVRTGRERMLGKAMEKYLFKFEPLCAPDGLITEGDRLVGLRFRRTRIEKGRVLLLDETFERRGSCVISSIGSIPEPIEGIPMRGELFDFSDLELGRLAECPTVFSAGNVVTGKGNIVASRKHARDVSEKVTEAFLGLGSEGPGREETLVDAAHDRARERAHQLADHIECQAEIAPEALAALRKRVRERQAAVGYPGSYAAWIEAVTPPDMA
ncbi:MAG: hypothetical protein OEM49_09240, partial [Myxococcales bacterium]|nr:hypothetical protein [Myxococcales bacterium]